MKTESLPRGAKSGFVLVHGAWHGAWAWGEMTPRLARAGHASVAPDLPGAGPRARFPESFLKRPLDMAAFAKEKSPVAHITQRERTAEVVDAVKSAAALGDGKVVLVGHSWGGLTVSRAAEAAPELIRSVVYLSGFMLPDGMSAGEMLADPAFGGSQTPALLCAAPPEVGALRIDPRSSDPAYVSAAKEAYYADVDDERFRAVAHLLCCDEPAEPAEAPMAVSAANFGSIERRFIRMGDDNSIPPAAQDRMIELTDAGVGGKTKVHRMSGGHSPFFARPDALLEEFLKAAGSGA